MAAQMKSGDVQLCQKDCSYSNAPLNIDKKRDIAKKNPELTSLVNEVAKVLWKWHDHRKIQLKLPYGPVMCDTLRRLAATKHTLNHFQQEYEFHNNVYVDGRKTSCSSPCAQLTSILKLMPDTFKTSYGGILAAI
ncbi:hypothetical protein TNCV_3661881 [Trichonephila clavipes]|nr:hypothetical protein TNCV_3661881 [Trichonephila clavipes]